MPRKKKPVPLPVPPNNEVVEIYTLADVEELRTADRPAFRMYPESFISSIDFSRLMSKLEQISYIWMLFYSWESDIQCFLPYKIETLRHSCEVTESRFIKMWKHILSKKFKFARHQGQLYIYNPRLLKEWNKSSSLSESGRNGGLQRALNAGQKLHGKSKEHTFDKSPFYDKRIFIEALKGDKDFAEADHAHYYEKLKAWAQDNKRSNWLDQGKVFILNSVEKNKLKFRNDISPANRKQAEKNLVNRKQNYNMN